MTDVLGTCESWDSQTAVVRREDGTVVEIRIADIVSGKPVPPRPSVRQRVSARDAESHSAAHWPGVLREALGEWELRTEPDPVDRLRKRANSCLAMGDPGRPLEAAAAAVVEYYARRGRTPMVQVETGSAVDEWFTDAGWAVVPGGDSLLMLGSTSRARRLLGHTDEAGVGLDVEGPRARATAVREGIEVGSGSAALDADWLGVHGLEVLPSARRRGVARAVTGALLDFGAERGATTVWLHVETDNEPAIALYESMGLAVHHECRYLAPVT
jgi:N-acetylglutamate synthase